MEKLIKSIEMCIRDSNRAICEQVTVMGYAKERIKADCAEPKSIDELREAGLQRIRALSLIHI